MRFSKAFIYTKKEAPSEATLPSHKYLIRGCYIQSVGAGLYNFLPLGKRVLDKIRNVAKEELDKAGCLEVDLAFVTPLELWEQSGRVQKYGKELLKFRDRKDNSFVLGPTHEEMMVNLVKSYVNSYKQLPINLYQIKTKFRDEIRPRFGLLRGREFLMKDGYSFHSSTEDMKREFDLMEKTYSNIFRRLGLDFRIVEADSGAIGGSGSKEFMVLANSGEDTLVICTNCDYGANIEAAKRAKRKAPLVANEEEAVSMTFGKFHTPEVKTIEQLSEFFHINPFYTLKIVAKKAIFEDGSSKVVLFGVRGSDDLQEVKALNAIDGAIDLEEVSEEELKEAGFEPGFIGPKDLPKDAILIVDKELENERLIIAGANEKDYHYVGLNLNDLDLEYKDLVEVKEGDICPKCGGVLKFSKGIEVGHIFQLGTRYSEPLDAKFLDENGKLKPFIMGTYGIGISRLVAAIVEQHHDSKGIIWTKESAPFEVEIIISNIKKEEENKAGFEIYEELIKEGIEVLIDDRKERFGFKMSDFELIGIPYGIIVGKKIKDGIVEIVDRKTLNKEEVKLQDVVEKIKGYLDR
ncbi:MAG: proline--tRNA ligase [Epsilonproteobacteria bacterium]|nr:proline--tRNA ligase [Campylobacterota bacterium]